MGTTAQKLQAIVDSKAEIADAIEARGGTVPARLADYAEAILALPTGTNEDELWPVEFMDYDGTIVYHYTEQEALQLSALPALPTRENFQNCGWNWTLADIKTAIQNGVKVRAGCTYRPSDGKTRIKIAFNDTALLAIGSQTTGDECPATTHHNCSITFFPTVGSGDCVVDWGDGTHLAIGNARRLARTHLYNVVSPDRITVDFSGFRAYNNDGTLKNLPTGVVEFSVSHDYGSLVVMFPTGTTPPETIDPSDPAFAITINISTNSALYMLSASMNEIGNFHPQSFYSRHPFIGFYYNNGAFPRKGEIRGERPFAEYTITFNTTSGLVHFESSICSTASGSGSIIKEIIFGSNARVSSNFAAKLTEIESISIPPEAIPDSETIGWRLTDCSRLKSFVYPVSPYSNLIIGESAFEHCDALKRVSIPKNLKANTTNFSQKCFNGCSSLLDFRAWDITGGWQAFNGCSRLVEFSVHSHDPSSVYGMFYNCSSLRRVSYFGRVGQAMFYGCAKLTTEGLCQSTTSGTSSFAYAEVINGNASAFAYCRQIKYARMFGGNPNPTVADNQFEACTGLRVFAGNPASIGAKAFYNSGVYLFDFRTCSSIPSLASTNAFQGTPDEKRIVVPDNLYSNWIADANWSSLAAYIVRASDYTE